MITLQEMMNGIPAKDELLQRNTSTKIRVAVPGIIKEFNSLEQTVIVQPAIRELVNINGQQQWLDLPLLLDVPIVLPRAGGFVITMPIKMVMNVLLFLQIVVLMHGGNLEEHKIKLRLEGMIYQMLLLY